MRTTAHSGRLAGVAALIIAGGAILAVPSAAADADNTAPTTPTNLQVIDADPHSLTVDWTPSTDDVGVQGYCITIVEDPDPCINDPMDFGAQSGPITQYSLDVGTTYTIEVQAKDAAQNVSAAARVNGTTDTFGPPRNFRVVSQQDDEVTLDWDPPAFCDGDCILTYRIFDGTRLETVDGEGPITIEHLNPGTHELRIMGTTLPRDSQDTALSNPVTVTVDATDVTPPTTPTNYQASFVLTQPDHNWSGEWTLTWDQSTDDVTAQSAIEYDLMAFDSHTGQLFVDQYSFARGTGQFETFGPSTVGWGPIRAADEAGNTSVPSEFPAQ